MNYQSLPEYKRLIEVNQRLTKFQKEHEEEVPCRGCKFCLDQRDWDEVLAFRGEPKYPKLPCSHRKVVREHLSPEKLHEYDEIFQEMTEASNAYMNIIVSKKQR